MVDLRINETFQTGAVRKPYVPFCRLVGTVSNSADAVRLETAPTGSDKSGSKLRGESVYLFLGFTIVFRFLTDFGMARIRRRGILPRCL